MSIVNNQQKMLDILFAKRNKSYGAYAIRSAYGSTIFRSLFIVFFTVVTSAGLAFWLKENPIATIETCQIPLNDSILVIPFMLEDPIPDKPEPQPKNNESGSTSSAQTATLISDNASDTTLQVTNNDITPVNSNTTSGTGTETGTTSVAGTGTTNTGGGTNTGDPTIFVDESPEFEGGHSALLAFVRKNLVYPSVAAEVGKQGTLYVKFVVDETGKVSNVLLQNNLGYGLDAEAMRVMKLIPKFKSPGKVQGKPVKTYYQIPIKFKLG